MSEYQQIPRERADAAESFGVHASGQVASTPGFTTDVCALNRAARLTGRIRCVPVPDGTVVDDDRARRAARHDLAFVVRPQAVREVVRGGGPLMRARHEASGPVVAAELVHHEDETYHWPPVRVALVIRVEN